VRWIAGSWGRAFLIIFLLGFTLRLGVLRLIPEDVIPPNPQWETGAVSISLAHTGRFADPYLIPTGPTAHMPPLYVGAASLLYRVLGVGHTAGVIRWILILAAYSVLWAALPWIGGKTGLGREAGVLGGLAGAIVVGFPGEIEPLSALAMALILVAFLSRWTGGKTTRMSSLLLGLAIGVAFHLQPVLLPVVLGCLLFELWWHRGKQRAGLVAVLSLGIALACLPWGWRNYQTFHEIFFIRGNLGLELYVGNHDNAHADIDVSSARHSFVHPRTDLQEAERVLQLGEAAYMREKQAEALAWIADNPGEFMKLTATRMAYFWAGPLHRPTTALGYLVLFALACLGAWRRLPALGAPERAALLIPLMTYPLIYYIVAYMPRYAEPVRWILFLLAGAMVWQWISAEEPTPPTEQRPQLPVSDDSR
jgi:hypothetical protein